jgi:hypothetical protein
MAIGIQDYLYSSLFWVFDITPEGLKKTESVQAATE